VNTRYLVDLEIAFSFSFVSCPKVRSFLLCFNYIFSIFFNNINILYNIISIRYIRILPDCSCVFPFRQLTGDAGLLLGRNLLSQPVPATTKLIAEKILPAAGSQLIRGALKNVPLVQRKLLI